MKYIKKILDNGMTIILMPMLHTQIIAMGFFVNAGSRNETKENSGIAHFLEHMMFKGTKTRNSNTLFKQLDMLGTNYNAATTTQNTYYYIYGNSDDTKKILDIILDIYINPEFSTKEIKKEKKVIIEEMRMRMDMPLTKLYSEMHKNIFRDTSLLSRDIIGTADTVLNFKREDFIEFRESMYIPKNTVFVITGNFSAPPIYKMVVPILQSLTNSDIPSNTYSNEKNIILKNMLGQNQPYVYIKKNILYQQVYVLLGFPMYDLYKTKHREIDLLTALLSSGFSSRLNKSLREDNGITYSSVAYPIVYSDAGLYLIQMVLNPAELVKGLKILMKELKNIKTDKISNDEMVKIINVTKNESLYSLTNPLEMLIYFGLSALSNKRFKPNLKKDIAELKKITDNQIQNVAKEIFIRDKINLYIYGNVLETDFNFMDL